MSFGPEQWTVDTGAVPGELEISALSSGWPPAHRAGRPYVNAVIHFLEQKVFLLAA